MNQFVDLRGHYDAYVEFDGDWMTVDIKRVPIGLFNNIIMYAINEYESKGYVYREKFELSREDGNIRMSLLFKAKE